MKPTMELRILRIPVNNEILKKYPAIHYAPWDAGFALIYQQKWIEGDNILGIIKEEWRDIPIEQETEQPQELNMYDLEGRN